MKPINQQERKQAFTRFWGLYAAIGFLLVLVIMGGSVSRKSAITEKDIKACKNLEQQVDQTNKLADIRKDVAQILTDQYTLHSRIQGIDITTHINKEKYLEELKRLESEAKGLISRTLFHEVDSGTNVSIDLVRELLELIKINNHKLYAGGISMQVEPTQVLGLRSILDQIAEDGQPAPGEDPDVMMLRQQLADAERALEAKNESEKDRLINDLNREKARLEKDARQNKALNDINYLLEHAKGVFIVAKRFVTLGNGVSNRSWFEKNLKSEYESAINDYKGMIENDLTKAEAYLSVLEENNLSRQLKTSISDLKRESSHLTLN